MLPTILVIATLGTMIVLLAYWLITDEDCGDFGENE